MQKYTKHCPHCDSENVLVDAFARWDDQAQSWELHDFYETAVCNDCGAGFDTSAIVEKELESSNV